MNVIIANVAVGVAIAVAKLVHHLPSDTLNVV